LKIAITDACIFIDLDDLGLTTIFFHLDVEVHTSVDVVNELYQKQKEILQVYESVGKLVIHNISDKERKTIVESGYPKALSSSDQTVLFLAEKYEAIILSSDKPVRNCAKLKAIEYHGMLWIFDRFVEHNLLSKEEAAEKLEILVKTNIIYQNSIVLLGEISKRLKSWEKKI
jgi:hypothetical protein